MGRVIISGGSRATIPYVGPKASLTPTSGVTYTNGLSGLEPSEISSYAQAISNVTGVTNDVTAMYIDYGDVHRKISVGDQVMINVNNVDRAFDVLGFNHDELTDGNAYGKNTKSGKAGLTLQMHDCPGTKRYLNSSDTNKDGWENCTMRTSILPEFYDTLSSAWQNVIKKVNKLTSAGSKSTVIGTTSDGLFLLSEIEIFGVTTYSVVGEGTQYSWYKIGNSKIKTVQLTASSWWERSPQADNGTNYCLVSNEGKVGYASPYSSECGVSFAFCI